MKTSMMDHNDPGPLFLGHEPKPSLLYTSTCSLDRSKLPLVVGPLDRAALYFLVFVCFLVLSRRS